MADTVVSDAVKAPQDEGVGSITNGNEDWNSAGLQMLLAQAIDTGSYVRSGLEFTGHDATNNTVDLTAGVCYLSLSPTSVSVQSGVGGATPPPYDTALPDEPSAVVVIPNTVASIPLQDATLSDVWVAYATDGNVSGVNAGEIYVRSDDTGSVTAPPHPNVNLGSANPDNSGADTLANRETGSIVPEGFIGMYSGSINDIPDGWSLCDGTNGTPDLRNRFVTGAGDQYSIGDTGGSDEHTLSVGELPSHTHDYEQRQQANGGENNFSFTGEDDGTATRTTTSTGNNEAHENRPPYYALAYIQKV